MNCASNFQLLSDFKRNFNVSLLNIRSGDCQYKIEMMYQNQVDVTTRLT